MLVNKQQFKNALAKASILTSSALTGDKVRFTALGGQASITASNGAGMGIFRFECGADGDMAFVIEAKRLAIVNSLRGDPDFTLAGDKLTISQGETTTSLPVEPPEALAVPEMYLDKDKAFEVDPAKLKRIFTQVAYARDTVSARMAVASSPAPPTPNSPPAQPSASRRESPPSRRPSPQRRWR